MHFKWHTVEAMILRHISSYLSIACFNSQSVFCTTGHFSSKCTKERKSKPTVKPDPKKEGTSAAAVDSSSDDEGAWATEEVGEESVDWFQEAVGTGDVVDKDWFEEESAAAVKDNLPELLTLSDSEDKASDDEEESGCGRSGEEDAENLLEVSGEAFMVAESVQSAGRAELYDSGCTNHISPYKDQLTSNPLLPVISVLQTNRPSAPH
jgi:hypothetical protein